MDITFANPLGFWALLGLPAVIAIHFLQRRARQEVITTLFLLETLRRESEAGHRFERLRTSWPFWLQLLMVLMLTWLLVHPRWKRDETVQQVAIVLDASASMQAFRGPALEALERHVAVLAALAARTEYTLLTSAPESAALYHGMSAQELAAAVATSWQPWLGSHDPMPALRTARSLAGREGVVVYVTDRLPAASLPYGARYVAVGEPLENCGFTGVTIEEREGQDVFRALIHNFSGREQVRTWWIESEGRRSPESSLTLGPGQSYTLQAAFPDGVDSCRLVLSGDRFSADDDLPLVRPHPKPLTVQWSAEPPPAAEALREVFAAFPHLSQPVEGVPADIIASTYNPLAPTLPESHAIIFANDPQPGATYLAGVLLMEPSPLMEGLNWQSLLVRDTLPIPRAPEDRVLLWQNERPLIVFRRTPAGKQQLLFNFNLQTSNARKLPALAVLLYRFLEQVRAEKIAPAAVNVIAGQKLELARILGPETPPLEWVEEPVFSRGTPEASPVPSTVTRPAAEMLRAPQTPGFFRVSQGGTQLLTAAAYFADPDESNFAMAASGHTLTDLQAALVEQHSVADTHWRLWVIGLCAVLLLSWWWQGTRAEPRSAAFAK